MTEEGVSKRTKIIDEVISTEETYVASLRFCIDEFVNPLSGIISPDEHTRIFANISVIADFQKVFLEELRTRNVSHVFAKNADFLRMYTQYVSRYDGCLATINSLKSNKKLQTLMDTKRKAGHEMPAYLILPIQRIPRYEMLLKALLKETPSTHSEYLELQRAFDKVKQIAHQINEDKRKFENMTKTLRIQNRIQGSFETLVQPHRFLVREGTLTKASTNKLFHRTHDPDIFFLFNDIFLRTTTSGKLKGVMDLSDCEIHTKHSDIHDDLTFRMEGNNVLTEKTERFTWVLIAESAQDCTSWVKLIKEQIESVSNSLSRRDEQKGGGSSKSDKKADRHLRSRSLGRITDKKKLRTAGPLTMTGPRRRHPGTPSRSSSRSESRHSKSNSIDHRKMMKMSSLSALQDDDLFMPLSVTRRKMSQTSLSESLVQLEEQLLGMEAHKKAKMDLISENQDLRIKNRLKGDALLSKVDRIQELEAHEHELLQKLHGMTEEKDNYLNELKSYIKSHQTTIGALQKAKATEKELKQEVQKYNDMLDNSTESENNSMFQLKTLKQSVIELERQLHDSEHVVEQYKKQLGEKSTTRYEDLSEDESDTDARQKMAKPTNTSTSMPSTSRQEKLKSEAAIERAHQLTKLEGQIRHLTNTLADQVQSNNNKNKVIDRLRTELHDIRNRSEKELNVLESRYERHIEELQRDKVELQDSLKGVPEPEFQPEGREGGVQQDSADILDDLPALQSRLDDLPETKPHRTLTMSIDFSRELMGLHNQLREARKHLVIQTRESSDIDVKLQEMTWENKELSQKVGELQQKLETMENEVNTESGDAPKQIEVQQQEIARLESLYELSKNGTDNNAEELQEARETLKELQDQLEASNAECTDQIKKVTDVSIEIKELKSTHGKQREKLSKDLTDAENVFNLLQDELQTQNQELKLALEDQSKKFQMKKAECESALHQLSASKEKLHEMEKFQKMRKDNHEAEIAELKMSIKFTNKLQTSMLRLSKQAAEGFKVQLERAERKLKSRTKEFEALVAALESRRLAHQEEIEATDETISGLQQDLKLSNAQTASLRAEMTSLKSSLDAGQNLNENAQDLLSDVETLLCNERNAHEATKSELEQVQGEQENIQTKNYSREKMEAEYQNKISALEVALSESQSIISSNQTKFDEMQKKTKDETLTSDDRSNYKNQIETLKKDSERIFNKQLMLRSRLGEDKKLITDLQKQVEMEQKQHEITRTQLEEASRSQGKLVSNIQLQANDSRGPIQNSISQSETKLETGGSEHRSEIHSENGDVLSFRPGSPDQNIAGEAGIQFSESDMMQSKEHTDAAKELFDVLVTKHQECVGGDS